MIARANHSPADMTPLEYFTEVFEPAHRAEFSTMKMRLYRRAVVAFMQSATRRTIAQVTERTFAVFVANWRAPQDGGHNSKAMADRVWLVVHHAAPDRFPLSNSVVSRRLRKKVRTQHPEAYQRYTREPLPKTTPISPDMTLLSYLATYLSQRDVSEEYRRDLLYTVNYFNGWAGDPVRLCDLSDELLNEYLSHASGKMAARSVKHHRTNLLSLWNAAYAADLVKLAPRRVRKIKVPRTVPVAWTVEQMRALLKAAENCTGTFHRRWKMKRSLFWRAYLCVAWDTGLRPLDLVLLRFDQIGTNGALVHVQHKTGDVKTCHLQPETMAAVEAIAQPERDCIFGGVFGIHQIRKQFAKLVKQAGLVGSCKKLRKSSATAVECVQPGAASAHLGHRTPDMARRHYIDPQIARPAMVQPPCLIVAEPMAESVGAA